MIEIVKDTTTNAMQCSRNPLQILSFTSSTPFSRFVMRITIVKSTLRMNLEKSERVWRLK
jgi:hypothetical protein